MWMAEPSEMFEVLAHPSCSVDVRLTVRSDTCSRSTCSTPGAVFECDC